MGRGGCSSQQSTHLHPGHSQSSQAEPSLTMLDGNDGLSMLPGSTSSVYHDDAMHESPEVKEALSRLPQDLLDGRAFRIQRALHCAMLKTVLPKDQWPTYEEDREKGRYLQPYLKEVQAEKAEKEAWGN